MYVCGWAYVSVYYVCVSIRSDHAAYVCVYIVVGLSPHEVCGHSIIRCVLINLLSITVHPLCMWMCVCVMNYVCMYGVVY